jgi:hypothetical protein
MFLGSFARLRKETTSFVMSVRPSVCLHGATRLPMDGFSWNLIFQYFFEKSVEKIQVSLKSDKNKRVLYKEANIYCPSHLAHFFSDLEMFQTKVVEKIKTHILCSITFSNKPCRLWDMRKSTVQRGRPYKTIWCTRTACCIPKATNTYSQYIHSLLFHCNNGCKNAPQSYVIRTMPVLFINIFKYFTF